MKFKKGDLLVVDGIIHKIVEIKDDCTKLEYAKGYYSTLYPKDYSMIDVELSCKLNGYNVEDYKMIELSKVEMDILQSLFDCYRIEKLKDFSFLRELKKEKGYFKNVNENMEVSDILKNAYIKKDNKKCNCSKNKSIEDIFVEWLSL